MKKSLSRASVILASVLIVTGLSSVMTGCSKKEDPRPKYIFYFLGDGMGNAQIAAAESWLSYKQGKLGGEQLFFTTLPVSGLVSTYSADHQVTCSSASATAFSCGVKTNNGYIGVGPDGQPARSIAMDLHDEGYKVGIMSSVPVNHATPAAYYGHNISRNGYYDISMEIPAAGYEFFGGLGFLDFYGKAGDQESTAAVLERNGYKVCYGEQEFLDCMDDNDHIILCQETYRDKSTGALPLEDSTYVTLAEMLKLNLDYFGDDKPFFIMCEGGEIDWFAHDNKVYPMVHSIIRFDDAVKVAYEFYLKHPDETLIVVTADHETGGLTIGCDFSKGYASQNWDIIESEWSEDWTAAERRDFQWENGIGWTTAGHTGSPVPVFAIGKGAERFSGRIDNTDIPAKLIGK